FHSFHGKTLLEYPCRGRPVPLRKSYGQKRPTASSASLRRAQQSVARIERRGMAAAAAARRASATRRMIQLNPHATTRPQRRGKRRDAKRGENRPLPLPRRLRYKSVAP
ncbi:MAG: hypothetical protein ACLUCU_08170, partial [Slackia sp.]